MMKSTTNRTTEDYIKNIYTLQKSGELVTTSALAERMQLSDPSVTDMIKRLSGKGYVRHAPYRGAELTAAGKAVAMKIVRRHRLWEMFLVQHLGYTWDQIHDEAERLEHVTSELLETKLDEALGFPLADPHGDPIPSADGTMDQIEYVSLADYDAGARVRVLRVSDRDPLILQHAAQLGLGLGTVLSIDEKRPFDGSMRLRVGGTHHYVSRVVAQAIFVEREVEA